MTMNQPHNLSVLPLGKGGKDLERTPPWDADRIGDALNRTKFPQTAVITTTECSSNPMVPSRKPLITLIDEVMTTAAPTGRKTALLSWWGLRHWKAMISEEHAQPPLPLYKSAVQPWHFGNLHLALHKCRPQTAILCWFWISPSLLKKYLTVYFSTEGRESTHWGTHGRLWMANYPLDTSKRTLVSGWSDAEL